MKKTEHLIEHLIKGLYDYQFDCFKSTNKYNKGICLMPTGTGKTRVESVITAISILKNPGFRIYVINAPRIMLSYQLMNEVYQYLVSCGIESRYMCVHSGGQVDLEELELMRIESNLAEGVNIPYSQIASSTSSTEIKDFIEIAKKQDLPVVLFSTYNSAERIGDTKEPIEIVLNDEAQYLVQERFHDILNILKSKRCYFFTATTIHTPSDKGRGMNNVDSYGEVIYSMSPREAIDRGKMVRPRMHFVINKEDIKYNSEDFQKSLGKIIKEAMLQHQYALKGVQPKILISCKGVGDIKIFMESKEYKELRRNGVDIFAVASDDDIGNNINGEKTNRQEFLKILKQYGKDKGKRLIVLHFDILAEGIDVSGFTGIVPMRTLGKSKFLQTYGRAARLDPFDRERITNGELKPNDLHDFNKPYAWVIIPMVVHENADNQEHIGNLITELRSYGFNPSEDIVSTDIVNGLPTMDGLEALNEIKKECPNIGNYIEKVEADYEDERIANLSKEEYELEIFKKYMEQ